MRIHRNFAVVTHIHTYMYTQADTYKHRATTMRGEAPDAKHQMQCTSARHTQTHARTSTDTQSVRTHTDADTKGADAAVRVCVCDSAIPTDDGANEGRVTRAVYKRKLQRAFPGGRELRWQRHDEGREACVEKV